MATPGSMMKPSPGTNVMFGSDHPEPGRNVLLMNCWVTSFHFWRVVPAGILGSKALIRLSDVLIGSLGLTGVITLAALLMGVLLAGIMFWVRSRSSS